MEFSGYIYDNKNTKRQIFDFLKSEQDNIEYPINSKDIRKYYVRGFWIVQTTLDNFKKNELVRDLRKSKFFAKILISTKSKCLKFDYAENGYHKKQIIIKNGELIKQIGFQNIDIKSKSVDIILDELLWEHFKLDNEFIEFHDDYLISVKDEGIKHNIKTVGFDLYILLSIPQAILATLASPFLVYFTSRLLILIIGNSDLWSKEILLPMLLAWLISMFLLIYIFIFIYREIRNLVIIRKRLLNDKIITLPNKRYSQ